MKKLTKYQTLQECSKMWHWLAEHPGEEKVNYFMLSGISKEEWPYLGCYCCEYVFQYNHGTNLGDCHTCPLLSLWGEHIVGNTRCACEHNTTSPYVKWTITHHTKYATEIAKAADDAIAKLPRRNHVEE